MLFAKIYRTTFFLVIAVFVGAALIGCGGGGGGGSNSCAAPDYICPAGEFCKFELGACGALGVSGTCTTLPMACTADVAPVCSCDRLTFSNQCLAETGGHSIIALAECS